MGLGYDERLSSADPEDDGHVANSLDMQSRYHLVKNDHDHRGRFPRAVPIILTASFRDVRIRAAALQRVDRRRHSLADGPRLRPA